MPWNKASSLEVKSKEGEMKLGRLVKVRLPHPWREPAPATLPQQPRLPEHWDSLVASSQPL